MSKYLCGATLLLPLLLTDNLYAAAQTQSQNALTEASKALGLQDLRSIEFSGTGYDYALGQAPSVNEPWPKFNDISYTRVVSFDPWATRLQRTRTQFENPPRGGGGQPLAGEQNQTQVIAAGSAAAQALPVELSVTVPQAFLKAAAAASDVAVTQERKDGSQYTVVTFTAVNKAITHGWIDDHNLVTRVETQIDNPVLGDIAYEASFTDYTDFHGVKFPAHIVQKVGGYPVLDLKVSDVRANVATNFQAQTTPAPTLSSERLGDGLYLITGGYAAVAVEFSDHILIIEGGQNDERSAAVIAEAKRLIPGKPIKALVNTHAHFDHAGGVRAYVAEGATIITHRSNQAYYEKIWANPHSLAPDRLAQNPKKANFKLVDDKLSLSEGAQRLELYHLKDFGHQNGMLVAYFPKEKLLVEADGFNPPAAPITQTPAVINPYQQSLAANIERLHLDVDRIIPIHLPTDNRKVTKAELLTAIGKGPAG